MAKKHQAFRIAVYIAAALLFAVFVIRSVYVSAYKPKTQTAYSATAYRTAEVQIYAVRNEKTLPIPSTGITVPMVDECSKVANGDAVAAVFADDAAALSYTSYLKLQSEIKYYNRLSELTASQYTDIDKLIRDADSAVFEFADAVYGGDLSLARKQALNVREKITSRQTAAGEKADYSGIIANLNAESASYLAAAGKYSTVYTPDSGYYVSETDGYEGLVNFETVASMGVDDIEKLSSLKPSDSANTSIGKLICGFDWYFVCNIDSSDMENIVVGQKKTVKLPYSSVDDFTAEVYKINDNKDGKTAVIFKVNTINRDLAALRSASASIVLESHTGYEIPNSAIRYVDGQRGVYILENKLIHFKLIDVFYASEDYSIVGKAEKKDNDKDDGEQKKYGYISLYDEVITDGKDFYDGMRIG